MARRLKPLVRLMGEQLAASDPRDDVWLSASAGTGKTHVLTARVLRLLLGGADPACLLCLTFTKAGAAEMADRIQARLAYWVRLRDQDLRKELFALGEPNDEAAVARARTLFAKVLDAPGGLRIQTIHAFCQTLLAGFPGRGGLAPGFRPIEGREEAALARRVLGELLAGAERGGDLGLIDDVQRLSRRLGEGAAEAYLMTCARAPEALEALGPGVGARVRRGLGVPADDVEAALEAACADDAFDCAALTLVARLNAEWATKKGLGRADRIAAFLAADPKARAAMLADLHSVWAKSGGEPSSLGKGQAPQHPDYAEAATRLHGACAALLELRARAALADLVAAGLRAGQAYARAYADAKRAAGLVDFDDLIRTAAALLDRPGMGEWVRYKLDQRTDHILVDEAQDTNAGQWSIIAALAGEFYQEERSAGAQQRHRTIFTVGDFKQAIFGFQGTDPLQFEAARLAFSARAKAVGGGVLQLGLDRSFRSTAPVLQLVDTLIGRLGADSLGLSEAAALHRTARLNLPGTVTLWRPVSADTQDDAEDSGEEGWIDDATRVFATRLARQIAEWLKAPLMLESEGRPLRPEDVMILVRSRGALAALLVARLHAEGVPVAGVDRLRLDEPLAVKDLLAALRFAVQPEDDLTLASLLVSPLFGWSQERLYRAAFGRKGRLWPAVRAAGEDETVAALGDILAAADFTTPYRLLERLLSGPLDGRRKLIARLGPEARDPIDELVNAALAFEQDATPTLQRFLDWFDRGEVDIKRDPSAPLDAVRVMTVHGAKGLQAPLVLLADATADPDLKRPKSLDWTIAEGAPAVPVFTPRKAELAGSIAEDAARAQRREREEHWRLLYVAATRAEERLVIGGALGPRAKGVPPARSWYAAIDEALDALGAGWEEDPIWSGARHHRGGGQPRAARRERARAVPPPAELPAWLHRAAPVEARPPRPLAPSSLGTDAVADPPPDPATRAAAERGRLLHALFERLPAVAPERRAAAGERWLTGSAGVVPDLARTLVADACAILGDPRFGDIFAGDALAEAPIAAVVGGVVVSGTVDRLLVTPDRVRVIDYKTGRRVPADAAAAPDHHLRQIAAYAAALATVFPGRAIEAALLYTAGPRLIAIPPDLLARHKPGLGPPEQIDAAAG